MFEQGLSRISSVLLYLKMGMFKYTHTPPSSINRLTKTKKKQTKTKNCKSPKTVKHKENTVIE